MKTYIVAYDPDSNLEDITDYLMRSFPCVRVLSNAWLINSDMNADRLHNVVISPMEPRGDIFTAEITGNYEGYLRTETQSAISALKQRDVPTR